MYKPICRRVRKGCVFNNYIKHYERVRVGSNYINSLRYANDRVLTADWEEKLLNILTTVTVESENNGLQLNAKKTETIRKRQLQFWGI